ncbi:carbonate dehydratase [Endozoicomonas montiporae]|uniref:Carbonate dehydratase n=2 Tax=Endozoicomonas montiporae TaxID=1027273 RepID=A0A081N5S3_9GAMM|nr:heavy metal translocating P-type ATPase [Endozoicomonas montiporae]AMO57306.1 cytochrome c oxidase accessory protein CcoI [Endozoicomonas montiporae CL-33]KEQ13796.1 carbonate dehydratase [Endozoicomonas montiporae]
MSKEHHHCFHCHLPIPGEPPFHTEIEGIQQPMCCPGCKAVAEAIIAGGLDNYYQHRTDPGLQAGTITQRLQEELLIYDRDDIQKEFVLSKDASLKQASLLIEGITCAACIWLLENHIGSLKGVDLISVNLSTHEAQVVWSPEQIPLSTILLHIHRIGYKAHPWRADRQEALLKEENRRFIRRLALAGIGTMQVMMYAVALYSGAITNDMSDPYRDFIRYISAIVATPVIFYSAAPFFKAALRDLRVRHLSMDVPVSIAIGGAYVASLWATLNGRGEVYFDSVSMFTFFLLTGRYLELRARHATSRAARALQNLLPSSCLKQVGEEYVRVPVAELQKSDLVRVLPGDSIPADGIITLGSSRFDESMLTGENRPVPHSLGDTVIGGSLNVENAIDFKVTQVGAETRMSAIMQLLNHARHEKPAIARMADRVAAWFVASVLIVATTVYWYWSGVAPEDAFWITLSVLVVTCPCALSLATPTALTAATGHLHQLGFLITRGHVLEGLEKINHVVFDKTGTLTRGNIELAEVRMISPDHSKTDVLQIAAALEAHSEHPIAKAFRSRTSAMPAEQVRTHTGQGVEGVVNDTLYRIGRADFCLAGHSPAAPEGTDQWLMLSQRNTPLCWFRIKDDSLRSEAGNVISQLRRSGIKVTLLSGDQTAVVSSVAEQLNISHWQAEANPDDKLDFIKRQQQKGERILMVGDGINDVPVLAGADISLAMGSASDLAKTHADAVLLSNDLSRLLDARQLARKTRSVIRQNLAWSLLYNLSALPLAASGLIAPWMAAIGMALSSLLVVGNALRLSKQPAPERLQGTDPHDTTAVHQSAIRA